MVLRRVVTAGLSGLAVIGMGISTASAQQPVYSWTGFSAWVGGGGHQLSGDVSVNDTTTRSLGVECVQGDEIDPIGIFPFFQCIEWEIAKSVTNRIASSLDGDPGVFGTVGVGYDVEATPGVVIGAFADLDWSNADADFSGSGTSKFLSIGFEDKEFLGLSSTTSFSGSMDVEYLYTIGGRFGFLSLNRQALLYVLGGYTRLELDSATAQVQNTLNIDLFNGYKTFDVAGTPFSVGLPSSFDGYSVGLGGEVKLTQAVSIKLEGRYSGFESKTVKYSNSQTKSKELITHLFGDKDSSSGCRVACTSVLKKTTSSSGTIDIDPEIYSLRAALVFSLN